MNLSIRIIFTFFLFIGVNGFGAAGGAAGADLLQAEDETLGAKYQVLCREIALRVAVLKRQVSALHTESEQSRVALEHGTLFYGEAFGLRLEAFGLRLDNADQQVEEIKALGRQASILARVIRESLLETLDGTQRKKKSILWMPHPAFNFTGSVFPAKGVQVANVALYGTRGLLALFSDSEEDMAWFREQMGKGEKSELQLNSFFEWLNNPAADASVGSKFKQFMSCVDFVYYNLYTSGVLSKQQILDRYKHEQREFTGVVSRRLKRNYYYGMPLAAFQPLQSALTAKPGDILMGFDRDGQPTHMAILGKNDRAHSLWSINMQHTPYPKNIKLKKLIALFSKDGGELKVANLAKVIRDRVS